MSILAFIISIAIVWILYIPIQSGMNHLVVIIYIAIVRILYICTYTVGNEQSNCYYMYCRHPVLLAYVWILHLYPRFLHLQENRAKNIVMLQNFANCRENVFSSPKVCAKKTSQKSYQYLFYFAGNNEK